MKAVLQFYRAGNALISAIATLLGFWIGGFAPWTPQPWLPVVAMILLTAFANSHNDLVDYAVDCINRPDRPLPSGRLSLVQGTWWAWGSLMAALCIGAWISTLHLALFALLGLMLWLYNRYLKGRPLVGNLAVAVLTATPLLLAALHTGWKADLWPPMLFAFLLSFAREVIKDIEDVPGDQAMGLSTFPIVVGISNAKAFAIVLLVATGTLLPLPVTLSTYGTSFLWMSVLLVLPALGLALNCLGKDDWHRAQKMVKFAMLGGILSALGTLHIG